MKTIVIGTCTVALLALAACSRRDPPPPGAANLDFEVPAAWTEPAGEGAPRAWLNEIGSVHLAGLVWDAWRDNPDLKAMAATIDQAAAQVALAGSRAGLQLNAAGSVGRGRINTQLPASVQTGAPARWIKIIDNQYDVGLSASWELDLWGGTLAEAKGAVEDARSAAMAFHWARFSLAGQVVRAWLRVIALDRQVALAETLVANHREALAKTDERFQAGIAAAAEVHAARLELASAEGRLTEQRQLRELASQGLAGLLGRYPDAAIRAGADDLPPMPPPPGAGLPSDLLARRPDVRGAGMRVVAAEHRIWNAKTAFFPRITLTASGGYRSDAIRDFLDPERLVWNLMAGIAAPLLDGGRNQAALDLRRAQQVEALARYQATVLRAFGEVEGALAAGERLAEREGHLRAVVREAEATAAQAQEQYDAGLVGVLELLAVRRRVIEARMGLEAIRLSGWTNRIDLYLALGGAPLQVTVVTPEEAEAMKAEAAKDNAAAEAADEGGAL